MNQIDVSVNVSDRAFRKLLNEHGTVEKVRKYIKRVAEYEVQLETSPLQRIFGKRLERRLLDEKYRGRVVALARGSKNREAPLTVIAGVGDDATQALAAAKENGYGNDVVIHTIPSGASYYPRYLVV